LVTLPGKMPAVPNTTTSPTGGGEGAVELAIATIFKNEAPYLREWIEFHRLVGVERFYLYDNRSDDGSLDVLEPYRRAGTVVITDWPRHPGQMSAYSHCARTYADDAAWIAFIDIDEFFFAPDGQDLRVVLAEFDRPEVGGIAVNYADFGTSGHLTRPSSLVIESYLHRVGSETGIPLPHLLRAEGLDPADSASYYPMCAHVSSVVRPGRVLSFRSSHYAEYHPGTHAVTENGDPTEGPLTERVSMRRLRMNHYWTKSVEECKRKCLRGRSDNGETRAWPHEFILRERAMRELDVEILRYVEPLRNVLGVDGPSVDAIVADAVERASSWSPEILAHEPGLAAAPSAISLGAMQAGADEPEVRVLGQGTEWADGSEERVLSILREATDRSSGADELAATISDWPTRYHFSPLRPKILSPLRVAPRTRVLDLGGGTGPLTRKLGELGAEVVLLDGSALRARAGAARCAGLPNVSVTVGTIFDLDETTERFDIVVAVGLLEYTSSSPGGAERFLQKARSLLTPNGVVAIAIENAIGLKYLLGYAEDHVGLPWVSWEGYLGIDRARTYSRRELASMLSAVGLSQQAWFYPFPDYKLPTVIVSEAAYGLDEPGVVDAIAPRPCTTDASLPALLCDPRAAHWTMLRAGLGREVANSFLVVAAGTEDALEAHVDRETLAWLSGGERRARFMRDRRLVSSGSGLAIVDDTADRADVAERWLSQRRVRKIPYVSGDPLDRLVLAGLAKADGDRVRELLALWAQTLKQAAVVADPRTGDPRSPFRAEDDRLALPSDYLDSQPANFVYGDGALFRIDVEWESSGLVDFELVAIRGLFYLSFEAVRLGLPNPFSTGGDIASMTATLAEAAGIGNCELALRRLPAAEADLQAIVLGVPREDAQANMDRFLRSSFEDLIADVPGPLLTGLRRQLEDESLQKRALEARLGKVELDLASARNELSESLAQIEGMARSRSWRITAPLRRVRRLMRR
jgi:SAM-dependent methyltransferase